MRVLRLSRNHRGTVKHQSGARAAATLIGLGLAIAIAGAGGWASVAPTQASASEGKGAATARNLDDTISDATVYSNVPDELADFAIEVKRVHHDASFIWNDQAQELSVWVSNSDAARTISEDARGSKLAGIRVQQAALSRQRLMAAASEIVESGKFGGVDVEWAAPRPDGSGIDVGYDSSLSTQAQRGALSNAYDGIPVSMVPDQAVELASRDLDSEPFIAGADMIHMFTATTGRVCTTSFAYLEVDPETFVTTDRLFTAEHCARGATGNWRTGRFANSAIIGASVYPFSTSDIAAIEGSDTDPYMYYGPNTSNLALAVWGRSTPIVGAQICYSGAPSGTVCGNQVTHTGLTVNYGSGYVYDHLVRTVQVSGLPAVGNGDSGGPAFDVTSEGKVMAVGIISGMSGASSTCAGDPSSDSRKCSPVAFYAPLDEYFYWHPYDALGVYVP